MKRMNVAFFCVLFFSLFCVGASAQVEHVISFFATDEATLIESLDEWFAHKDSKFGQTAWLASNVASGSNENTHYLVLNYPDYKSLQAALDGISKSAAFAKMERHLSGAVTGNGSSVYLKLIDNGKSEKAGDFLYASGFELTGSEQVFLAAQKEMIESALGKKAPGMLKIVSARAGGDSSHLAVLSAPSFAALNEFLDMHSGNSDWEKFQSKVGEMTEFTGASFLRVLKVWK